MINLEHERQRLRRQTLLSVLYAAWPVPVGFGLLRAALPEDTPCSNECLARELDYLSGKGWVLSTARAPGGAASQHRLTAEGLEEVERGEDWSPDRLRAVRLLRLRVLQALDLGRPHPLGLRLIALALKEDTDLDLTESALRRALAYLVARGLAEAKGDMTRISAQGMDYLSGDGDGAEGIARPPGW